MPRPKVKQDWVNVIYMLKGEDEKRGARAILAQLQEARSAAGISEPTPGLRTVGRYLREWANMPEEKRKLWRLFVWPESMAVADLPWEASATVLEFLAECQKRGWRRPTLRLVTWFWRATTAGPEAPFAERYEVALVLYGAEIAARPLGWRRAEAWLALGQMPGTWFGDDVGWNLAVSVGEERMAAVLAAISGLPPDAAESLARFLQKRAVEREGKGESK